MDKRKRPVVRPSVFFFQKKEATLGLLSEKYFRKYRTFNFEMYLSLQVAMHPARTR